MADTWSRKEADQLATVIEGCQAVVAAFDNLTDMSDGVERALETRQDLYTQVMTVYVAIHHLRQIHAEPIPEEQKHHA